MLKRRYGTGLFVAVVISIGLIALPLAGGLPNLLDDNRGDFTLEALESTAFTAAIALLGLNINPLTAVYSPVIVSGRVLAHPKIHNLYLDDDWDSNNPDAPTMNQLDAFTQALVSGHYLDTAGQYGVGTATFTGSHGRSIFCTPLQPVFDHAEFVELIAWITCEVAFNPVPPPGLFPAITGVPQTNDDTLYVIYLPRSMTIVDGGCDQLSAYHFFGAAPNFKFEFIFPIPYAQTFAFAVVPTACASGDANSIRDHITRAASHEIIEAAVDPLVGTGWINNSVVTDGIHGSFFSELAGVFSNISLDLKVGEAADICQDTSGAMTGPPAFQHPTPAVSLAVSDPLLPARVLVAPYWSNGDNACAPFVPRSTLTFGSPNYPVGARTFVTSSTSLTVAATDGGSGLGVASVSYRYFPQGTAPPAFTTQVPPAQFSVTGPDGPYEVDMFATGNNGIVEVSQSKIVVLDNTPPAIGIVVPATAQYAHSDTLTLNYSVSDGAGSGVASTTPIMDGASTVGGHGLLSGQVVNLLTELSVGSHTFSVAGADHVTNSAVSSVTFEIIVTPESIKQDVRLFLAAGLIKNGGLANSLLSKLDAAAKRRAAGACATAANIYGAFINELHAQAGKGVDATAAAIMIADAQYLIAHCP